MRGSKGGRMTAASGEKQAGNIIPFYLVVDVSLSMVENGGLTAANKIVPKLIATVVGDPVLGDKIVVGLIDFAGESTVVMPLGNLLDVERVPELTGRGSGTSYSAALVKLKETIAADVKQLHADNKATYRPLVFFVSDGQPWEGDDWPVAFDDLTTNFQYRPNIIPFAINEADPKTMAQLVYPKGPDSQMRLFVQSNDADPGTAIAGMAQVLLRSLVRSGSEGKPVLDTTPVAGVTAYPPIEDPDLFLPNPGTEAI